jgi:transcriptional regulator NrdR family protein
VYAAGYKTLQNNKFIRQCPGLICLNREGRVCFCPLLSLNLYPLLPILSGFPREICTFPLGFFSGLCQYVAMVCIYCASPTRVINSRPQKRLNHTWRRRQCEKCLTIFTSVESPNLASSVVVGEGPKFEPFDRDRLFASVLESLKHREDAVAAASSLTATITTLALKTAENARIERVVIAEIAVTSLTAFDPAAGVHYRAFHPTT